MNRPDIDTIRDLLYDASEKCGFNGHTKVGQYKKDIHILAEKAAIAYVDLPLISKPSFLYCQRLDTCFFYDRRMKPSSAFSGVMSYQDKDYIKIDETVNHIRKMLNAMQEVYEEWLQEEY